MASDKSHNHTKNASWFSPQFKTGIHYDPLIIIIILVIISGTAVSLNGVLDFVVYLGNYNHINNYYKSCL